MQEYDQALLKRVQKVDLEMAKYFVRFCQENGLLCYFCGGGCIGAVRHHGFIPWDDDLDFFMPRKDYERLKTLWKDDGRYALRYPTAENQDHNMFMTVRDRQTTMIKPTQQDLDIVHGIALDVFPLDGYPNSALQRAAQVFWGLTYQLFCAQVVPENHGRLVTAFGKLLLAIVRRPAARYRIWKHAEARMSRYPISQCEAITEICAGPHYMRNRYPKEIFADALFLDFEDTKMPVPVGYDRYLRIAFGDYMQLPPREKQVPAHDAVLLDPDHPYTQYKGRYYCVTRREANR